MRVMPINHISLTPDTPPPPSTSSSDTPSSSKNQHPSSSPSHIRVADIAALSQLGLSNQPAVILGSDMFKYFAHTTSNNNSNDSGSSNISSIDHTLVFDFKNLDLYVAS